MPIKSIYYLPIALVLFCGCIDSKTSELEVERSPPNSTMSAKSLPNQNAERVLIATIGGSDASTRYNVMLTLREGGINCEFSGSVGYGIFVKPNETIKAVELLRNAPGISQDQIEFVNLNSAAHDSD